tara:strand:+ start:423 stop:1244 length:822 start_codon:yes stop_codon:yes gene_type:complete
MNKKQPILIVGKTLTGKTYQAKEMLNDPIIFYANEFSIESLPNDSDVIIEDVHYKPNTDEIVFFIRNFKGNLVLTSIDKKSVPKLILNSCKVKLAGSKVYSVIDIAPRSQEPFNPEKDIFSLVADYLKNPNREEVKRNLLLNKPPDVFLLNALSESMHPSRLIYIDSKVKRRWPQKYFYEMLAYIHTGNTYGRVTMPKFAQDKEINYICRRLGLKVNDRHILKDILKDENVLNMAKKKLSNKHYRLLGLGEKPRKRRNAPIVVETKGLGEWYG